MMIASVNVNAYEYVNRTNLCKSVKSVKSVDKGCNGV